MDVWIVTATNADLAASTRARRFREDLYHRLAVVTLWIPPLRARGDCDAVSRHLDRAHRLFADLSAPRYLERTAQLARELRASGSPPPAR